MSVVGENHLLSMTCAFTATRQLTAAIKVWRVCVFQCYVTSCRMKIPGRELMHVVESCCYGSFDRQALSVRECHLSSHSQLLSGLALNLELAPLLTGFYFAFQQLVLCIPGSLVLCLDQVYIKVYILSSNRGRPVCAMTDRTLG